jgi:hypothetical protein
MIERGTSYVGPIDHLRHVPERMKLIVRELELGLRDSNIPAFDILSGTGHWMGLTIRLTSLGETLVVVSFNPQQMNHLQVKDVKEKLTRFFAQGPGKKKENCSSFYLIL